MKTWAEAARYVHGIAKKTRAGVRLNDTERSAQLRCALSSMRRADARKVAAGLERTQRNAGHIAAFYAELERELAGAP